MKLIQFGGLVGGAFVMLVATNTFRASLTSGDALSKQPRVDLKTYQLERERASGVTKQLLNVSNGAEVKHGSKAPADVAEAAQIDTELAALGVAASLYPDYSKRPALAPPPPQPVPTPTVEAHREEFMRLMAANGAPAEDLELSVPPKLEAVFAKVLAAHDKKALA